jgi:outer membrane protein TolC
MMTVLAIAILFTASDGETDPVRNDELHEYLVEAAEHHPELRARYELWMAALERVPQAKSLEDPALTYTQFIQSDINRFRAQVTQKFPWFGTRKIRADRAMAEAESELQALYAARNQVLAGVSSAYFEYAYLGDRIRITESQAEVLTFTEETASAKFALGLAAEVDLLRVQTEQTQLQDRYETLKAARPTASARLALAIGRNPGEALPWPTVTELPADPPPAPVLAARLRTTNPDLLSMDHEIAVAELTTDLAKKAGYPDITLGVVYGGMSKPRKIRPERPYPATLNTAYKYGATRRQNGRTALGEILTGQPLTPPAAVPGSRVIDAYTLANRREPFVTSDGGDDDIGISLGLTLPIWRNRIRAGVAEAKHKTSAAEHDQIAHGLELETQVRLRHFELVDAKRRHSTVEEQLVPQARTTYESLQSSYASGDTTANFLDVLASIQTLLDFELERARAFRDAHLAAADLDWLVGGFSDVPRPDRDR